MGYVSLYEQLLREKQMNGFVGKDKFTSNNLFELYYMEEKTDREIAELFGLTKNQISYQRKKLGITRKLS